MRNIDSLPDVLSQDLIEYFAKSHDDLNENITWEQVNYSLTPLQLNQVLSYIGERNKHEYEKTPEEERDARYRAGALHFMRDGNYITIFEEHRFNLKHKDGYTYASVIGYKSETYLTDNEEFSFYSDRNSEFSMFYPCQIVVENMTFNSASQYMAYAKAEEFRDRQLMAKIMEVKDINKYQELSQQVEYFYRPVYAMMVGRWLRTVLEAKFTQNSNLQAALFATKGTTIALATNENKRWDIGLKQDDPSAQKRVNWQGQNILGELLTELRVKLMEEY